MLRREIMIDEIAKKLTDAAELEVLRSVFYDTQYEWLSDLDDIALQLEYDELVL